jgi:hypothetical protein
MILRHPLYGHEADVMAVSRIFRAGISKPYDEFHGGSPLLAVTI